MDYYTRDEYWKNRIIRESDYKLYFFDLRGIYTCATVYEVKDMRLEGLSFFGEHYYGINIRIYPQYVQGAILALEVGDDVKKFIEYIEMIKLFYKENPIGIFNTIYLIKDQKYYFFNSNGIYSCLDEKNVLKSGIRVKVYTQHYDYKCRALSLNVFGKFSGKEYELDLLRKAFDKLKIGDKLEKVDEYYNEALKEKSKFLISVERFVTRIESPDFVRLPENSKETTFDYIHVDVNIVTQWDSDKIEFIKRNLQGITKMVFKSIENNRRFKKYGVPINFLSLSKVTVRSDLNSLHYVFELKEK